MIADLSETGITDRNVILIISRIDNSEQFKLLQMKNGKSYSLIKKVQRKYPQCYDHAVEGGQSAHEHTAKQTIEHHSEPETAFFGRPVFKLDTAIWK